ncbi:MAG: hypothetical protein KDD47_04205, partial [Acidobacteria bacterium]|nr:hypothetical protein [Acidobacteriota bacterium]
QLSVAFDEAVVGGDSASAFLVVAAGGDGVFSTSACAGGAAGDDVLVPILAVSSDGLISRLDLSDGAALGRASYRLLACAGEIADPSGNALDGDGDGLPGGDFVLDFHITREQLGGNPNLDDQLAPWTSADFAWTSEDVDGAPTSGAADVTLPDADRVLEHPCIEVTEEQGYCLAFAARISDPTLGAPSVAFELELFDAAGCSGVSLGTASPARVVGDTASAWAAVSGCSELPEGTLSVLPRLRYEAAGASPDEVVVDRLSVVTSTIFADGFESGDTSAWSNTLP